jgi:signal transduction histidine kinase
MALSVRRLRPVEDLSGSILDGLRAGLLATDLELRVVRTNAAAESILRRHASAMLGADLAEIIPSLQARCVECEERCELTVARGDGTEAALGLTIGPYFDGNGERIGCVVLFQDISAINELRRERDRLLQLAALGDALPSVLHELRNPLAAMTAMLEVLVEDTAGDMQADLHALLVEVRRMTLGLEGIGSLVRPVVARKYSAVDHAVREAVRLMDKGAAERGISLRAIGPDLPLLPLSTGPISGVVFNLVRNAIDACQSGGNITVDARIDNDCLALAVADDGVGMSEATAAQACDLFFTNKDKGSGIGLALCKQVAETSGGSLTIETQLGVGTTVTMRVPLPANH